MCQYCSRGWSVRSNKSNVLLHKAYSWLKEKRVGEKRRQKNRTNISISNGVKSYGEGVPGWLSGWASVFGSGYDSGVLGSSPASSSWSELSTWPTKLCKCSYDVFNIIKIKNNFNFLKLKFCLYIFYILSFLRKLQFSPSYAVYV